MIEIKNRWTGNVIFKGAHATIAACLLAAIAANTNLRGADLRDTDLSGANLRDTNLRGADLRDTDLSGADLRDTNLSGANLSGANLSGTNLSGANLSDTNLRGADLRDTDLSGANLRDTNLRGADLRDTDLSGANLRGANLRGANLRKCPVIIQNIHSTVYESSSAPKALAMKSWHTCDTTHSRAGWVVHLAGPGGAALEYVMGTSAAAAVIYMTSDPSMEKIPDFYCDNETALADMKRLADLEVARNGTAKK
jgi:hypothetical protein